MRAVLFVALLASACGVPMMVTYHQTVSTAAVTAAACRGVLSEAHEKKTADVTAKAHAGDKIGAQADLDRWLISYEKVKLACGSLKTTAKLMLNAVPIVEAAVNKTKVALEWIARITNVGLDVTKTLAEAGLKIPGGGE